MSRHDGFSATTGYPRVSTDVSDFWTELQTKSASVDSENLIPEGLDLRNFGAVQVFEMELQGNRQHYGEWTTEITLPGVSATYRNEGIVPLVMGSNVILDWSLAPLTLGADEDLLIKAVLSFGRQGYAGAIAPATSRMGVSAVLLLDSGAGYVAMPESRQGRRGEVFPYPATGLASPPGSTMQMQAFDLCPTLRYSQVTPLSRIGLSVGYDAPTAATRVFHVARAQILTTIIKKGR
jgi:hypothetical protein